MWGGTKIISMCGSCRYMWYGLSRVKCIVLLAVNAAGLGGNWHRRLLNEISYGTFGSVVRDYHPGV
jgi:hypothetical protein